MEALAIGPAAKYWFPSGLTPKGWTGIEFAVISELSSGALVAQFPLGAGVS